MAKKRASGEKNDATAWAGANQHYDFQTAFSPRTRLVWQPKFFGAPPPAPAASVRAHGPLPPQPSRRRRRRMCLEGSRVRGRSVRGSGGGGRDRARRLGVLLLLLQTGETTARRRTKRGSIPRASVGVPTAGFHHRIAAYRCGVKAGGALDHQGVTAARHEAGVALRRTAAGRIRQRRHTPTRSASAKSATSCGTSLSTRKCRHEETSQAY